MWDNGFGSVFLIKSLVSRDRKFLTRVPSTVEYKKGHLIPRDWTRLLNIKNSYLTEQDFLHSNLSVLSLNKSASYVKKEVEREPASCVLTHLLFYLLVI